MRELLLSFLLAAAASSQGELLGVFTHSGDVGGPSRKGSTEFDAARKQYRITGAGATIWARQDQFQLVWKEMSGNLAKRRRNGPTAAACPMRASVRLPDAPEERDTPSKHYFREQHALRAETTIANLEDSYINKGAEQLGHRRDLGAGVNRRLLEVDRDSHARVLTRDVLDRWGDAPRPEAFAWRPLGPGVFGAFLWPARRLTGSSLEL